MHVQSLVVKDGAANWVEATSAEDISAPYRVTNGMLKCRMHLWSLESGDADATVGLGVGSQAPKLGDWLI